jgi:hypothetical protein
MKGRVFCFLLAPPLQFLFIQTSPPRGAKRTLTATFKIPNDYLTLVDIEILQTKLIKPGTQRMFGASAFRFEFIALSLCED